MGFVYNAAATRQFRPHLDVLIAAGLLEIATRKKVDLWVLTTAERHALWTPGRRNETTMLPESPQHRKWRHSREAASERIQGYREELRALLDEADALLDAGTNNALGLVVRPGRETCRSSDERGRHHRPPTS